jgi:uncharacterized protein (DUF924 family)
MALPQDVVGFWSHAGPRKWFKQDRAFDSAIELKFEPLHHIAARRGYDDWIEDPLGALGLMILLDQFPRNLYRKSAHAFATDPLARYYARRAIDRGFDRQTEANMRLFFYLPFEHSEDVGDQVRSVELFTALRDETGDEETLNHALQHHDIILRFGRFPHRNEPLGRVSTPDELNFLDNGGFSA